MFGDFRRQGRRHAVDRELAGRIGPAPGTADLAPDRAERDDPSPSLRLHRRHDGTAQEKRRHDVDLLDAREFGRIDVGEHGILIDAGVVDQDVGAEFRDFVGEGVRLGIVGEIDGAIVGAGLR